MFVIHLLSYRNICFITHLQIHVRLEKEVTVTLGQHLITYTLELSEDMLNDTVGLVGKFNGDVSDDFTVPDGSTININSTDETIFHQFGQKCNYV